MADSDPSPSTSRHFPVRVYALAGGAPELMHLTGPTLDAVSLQLPAGVYTTLRTYPPGRVLGLGAHLLRLAESAALLGHARLVDQAALRAGLRAVLAVTAWSAARVRVTVPFDSPSTGVSGYIHAEQFLPYPEALYARGVRCATLPMERATPAAKYTAAIAAAQSARAQAANAIASAEPGSAGGAHELLRLDAGGHILEGLSSNFFAVVEGVLRTAGQGVLSGVTRNAVLSVAAGLVPVAERAVAVGELPRASEAFVTSASREVMPVVQVDQAVIGAGVPGPVTAELLRRYRALVEASAEAP